MQEITDTMNTAAMADPPASKSTLWFDITTLRHWQRAAVGVIRMEQQVARFLLDGNDPAHRFCWFDRSRGQYFALNRDEVAAELRRLDGYQSASAASFDGRPPFERRLRLKLEGWMKRLPDRVRGAAWRLVWRSVPLVRALLSLARRGQVKLRQMLSPRSSGHTAPLVAPAGTPMQFGRDDVYASVGLDWDFKDWPLLFRLKREHGFKVVLCCYDIIPIKLPHLCVADSARFFGHYFADLAWTADHVLCISDCSRRDLQAYLQQINAPQPPMSVIRLGSDLPVAPAPDSRSSDAVLAKLLEEDFLLFVSTIERRKNHETLYRAYTRLIDDGMLQLPKLVFVGMQGWGVHDFMADLRLDPRVTDKIVVLNRVSDEDLARLYQKARFTCYPSLYEGWGLPVAESLAWGKFCLSSHAASLPEVGGDFVEYLDPWDVPGWTAALKRLILHPDEVDAHNRRIASDYKAPQWRDSALEVVRVANLLRDHKATTGQAAA